MLLALNIFYVLIYHYQKSLTELELKKIAYVLPPSAPHLDLGSSVQCSSVSLSLYLHPSPVKNAGLGLSKDVFHNLHLAIDGDRDRDPHWSTGLSSQGPNEEQKEGEHEQGSQDREGCVHPLRWWD